VSSTAVIRPDILRASPELFGNKTVDGRSLNVEDLIAQLTIEARDDIHALLQARHQRQAQVAAGEDRYDFLDGDVTIGDPDGNRATVSVIRQGMLDAFMGRATAAAWKIAPSRPIPEEVTRPGLEGTGPCIDLGMATGALNSGASSWMWDWEDAGGDYRDQLYQAWRNLKQILAHEWDHRPFDHPTKVQRDAQGNSVPRRYTIDVPPEKWPTIFHRVPGLHLRNRQITVDGHEVPAIIPALVIHALNNHDAQTRNGSGIYYYIPKIESWQEAQLVGRLLKSLEAAMRLGRGSLKIKMLNERAEFVLQQEVIQWVLRENLIGPNVGRWDYLNSREDMFHHDPDMVIPNPGAVTMTEPTMTCYTRRNALLALLAGGMPIGGMAAQMQNPRAPENDEKALRDIWFDKLRERLTGLFVINGTLYDTYRQSWVATVTPAYVAAGREPLVAELDELERIVGTATADERRRLEALGVLTNGRITPLELSERDLAADKLFSDEARTELLARPQGPTTEEGLRHAMYMATEYMYQQLHGNNAAAIDDPATGLRFMNDLATYEIFWHFLYLTVFHGVRLDADGRYSKAGDRVSPELFVRLLDERRETVKQLFAKLGVTYEETDAELVLDILRRQVVETTEDGRIMPQPRWIKYGSRVLLSLIEQSQRDREAILDGIFNDRQDLVARIEQAPDADSGALALRALQARDYVYDVFLQDASYGRAPRRSLASPQA
jgi:malate synthase